MTNGNIPLDTAAACELALIIMIKRLGLSIEEGLLCVYHYTKQQGPMHHTVCHSVTHACARTRILWDMVMCSCRKNTLAEGMPLATHTCGTNSWRGCPTLCGKTHKKEKATLDQSCFYLNLQSLIRWLSSANLAEPFVDLLMISCVLSGSLMSSLWSTTQSTKLE